MTAIATTHWAGHHRHHHKPRADKRRVGKLLVGAALMRAMAEGRRRHGGGHGPGHGFGPGPFGPGGFGGFGRGFGPGGRGKRARRGDVRAAVLLLLEEEPRNGYQLMQELEERSGGVWRPSPGSIYPALSQLEDEGLVRSDESAGRRAFQLTDDGRAYIEENREALGIPWEAVGGDVPEGLLPAAPADDAARHGHHAGGPGRRRGPDRRGPQGPRGGPPLAVPDPRRRRRRRRRRARGGLAAPRGAPSPPQRAAQRPPPRLERAPRAQLLAQRAGRQPRQAGALRALQCAALARRISGARSSSVRAHSRGRSRWRSRSRAARTRCGSPLEGSPRRRRSDQPTTLPSCWT